jgi:hypothetical protein
MLRPSSPVPFKPLVPSLDLFRGTDFKNWGQALQASMRELSDHDGDVLRQALIRADGREIVA